MIEFVSLLLLYLLFFGAIAVMAVGAGHLFAPRPMGSNFADYLWSFLLRYALGLSLFSAMMIWLGLFGWINRWTVFSTVLIPSGFGLWHMRNASSGALTQLKLSFQRVWVSLDRTEKASLAFVLTSMAVLFLNILIGGMNPDMGHDTMWYHLPVPAQWAITGHAAAFPYVFPSNYPLALEAIYAGLLTYGDEILCSVLSAQIEIALLCGMVIVAMRFLGWRGALWAAASTVFAVAMYNGLAPIGTKHDRFASLLLLTSFGLLIGIVRDTEKNSALKLFDRLCLAGGVLVGTTIATKILTLGYILPMLAICAAALAMKASWRHAIRMICIVIMVSAVIYLPWAVRGVRYSGDPFFPFGANIVDIRQPFELALRGVKSLNNLYPFTLAGIKEALTRGLKLKVSSALGSSDIMLGLFLIAAVSAVFRRERIWRVQGVVLLSLLSVFVLIKGQYEVIRYFSIAYPLAAPAMASLLVAMDRRFRPRARMLLLCVLLSATMFTYIKAQLFVASFETVQWPFYPRITTAQRLDCSRYSEKGRAYSDFQKIESLIEPGKRVFVADYYYPFHLHRPLEWTDEVVGPLLREQLAQEIQRTSLSATAQRWRQSMRKQNFTYVLLNSSAEGTIYGEMVRQKWAESVTLPDELKTRWTLVRVNESK